VLMTAHPGTNKATFQVDLPRPRTLAMQSSKEFRDLTLAIWESLKDEVMRALENQL